MLKVTLAGQTFPEFNLTFNFTDTVASEDAALNMAVTQDSTTSDAVKLATDGSEILGRVLTYEDRSSQAGGKVVGVETVGGMTLPLKTGETIAVGDFVVGAGAGEVRKKAVDDTATGLRVWAVATDTVTVLL